MKRLVMSIVALGGALLLTVALAPIAALASSGSQSGRDILEFNTAFANVSPFIGAAGAIRGVTAAQFPWAVRSYMATWTPTAS